MSLIGVIPKSNKWQRREAQLAQTAITKMAAGRS
jgi:hypothetical protein